ncbi:MAG: Gfo/Idh/MocA family protein [Leadbetterella sp.]
MDTFSINRRNFLRSSASLLALSQFGKMGLDLIHPPVPYRVGLLGCGWYGKSDLFRLIQVVPVEVVAIADVDKNMLAEASELIAQRQKSGKKPIQFTDYNKLLASVELDLVLIGTPDHWHPLMLIDSIKAGAHVYLQKPISIDVLEGEAMVSFAQKHDKIVQVGTQRRSTPHYIKAKKDIIEKGLLGKISHVEMCCYYHMRGHSNPPLSSIPEFFDYERWVGPAPKLPFECLPHRGWWRGHMEYSNGIMGDMCVHMLDATRWMLGLGWPKKINAVGGIYTPNPSGSNTADTQTAVFEFEDLNCVWTHRSWGTTPDPEYPWAIFLYGEKGTLKISVYNYEFIPIDGGKVVKQLATYEKQKYPEDLKEKGMEIHAAPATRGHLLDWIHAIENKSKPVASIEEGHISTASCILANISTELKRALIYDPVQKIVKNDPEATQKLMRTYREGWIHPHIV